MGTYNLDGDVQTFVLTGQASARTWPLTATDGIAASHTDPVEALRRAAGVAADGTDITPAMALDWAKILSETLSIDLSQDPDLTYHTTVTQAMRAAATAIAFYHMSATETVTVTPALLVVQAYSLIEQLQLAPAIATATTFGLSVSDTAEVQDALVRFFGGVLSESVDFTAATAPMYKAIAGLSETTAITAAVDPTLVVRVTLRDDVEMTTAQALQMLYAPFMAEVVEVAGAYLSPGDGITTWAVNPKIGAVTEYTNYAFNSFARVGRRYIGATSEGLYVLDGDDDVGADIIATMKGGMLQLAGARFTSFKAAYLGFKGAGDVYLKLDAGDGRSYTYKVTAKDDETTRVRFGRGLRARYFTYTLTTTGQDFDLDTIEFIPILAARRV